MPSPLPKRILALESSLFVTARSALPSLFRSPIARASGDVPTVTGEPVAAVKVPSPLPSRTPR